MSTRRVASAVVGALERAVATAGPVDDRGVAQLARRLGVEGFVARHRDRASVGSEEDLARRFRTRVVTDAVEAIHAALEAAKVPHFFARGAVLAGTLYRAGDREIADIDVYVRPAACGAAVEALALLGYRELPLAQQGGPATLRAGTTLELPGVTGSPIDTVQLDLHWGIHPIDRLLHTPDAPIPELLWQAIAADRHPPAPAPEHHAALIVQHLAYHDLLHFRGLLDLALLWAATPRIDGAAFEAAARALGVLRVARAVHAVLVSEFGVDAAVGVGAPPTDRRGRRLMRALAIDEWMRWVATASEADHLRMTPRRLRRRLLLLERARDGARLLVDVVWPPAEHLRWRWPAASTRFGAWLRHLWYVARVIVPPQSPNTGRLPRHEGGAILRPMEVERMAERPRARDDVVFRQLDEEWVLFDPVADRLHALNLTGALIWAHLTGDLTVDEIAGAVSEAFDPPVEVDRVLQDVRAAVERFHRERLLARA